MLRLEQMKLNLGCHDRPLEGFVNIDKDQHPGVDVVSDVSKLERFMDDSADEIYASHILEHFPHPKTKEVLREWSRVLKKGGILYVGVPDFKRVVEIYLAHGFHNWIANYLWGDQEYATAFHYNGFDANRLRKILLDCGFSEVSEVDSFPYSTTDCSNIKSTVDGKSVSLNMVAVK